MQIENVSPVLYYGLSCDAEKSANSAAECIFEKNIAIVRFNRCTKKGHDSKRSRQSGFRNEIQNFANLVKKPTLTLLRRRNYFLANAGELKSSDRFCQLARKTFAYTCAIFTILNCKSGVLIRLWCNLAICDKITRFVAFFLVDDFCRLPFQSLKSNKINFSLGQHVVQKSAIGFAKVL